MQVKWYWPRVFLYMVSIIHCDAQCNERVSDVFRIYVGQFVLIMVSHHICRRLYIDHVCINITTTNLLLYSYILSLLDVLFSSELGMFCCKTCLINSREGYITKEMNKDEKYKTITSLSLTYVLCRKSLLGNVFM